MRHLPFLALSFVAVIAGVSRADEIATAGSAASVVTAERAFAKDGLAMGVDGSFLKWSTPNAVMMTGAGPRLARESLNPDTVVDPTAPALVWWPNWAGVAASGDLGFTTGGVEFGGKRSGHYFTIWRRQADAGWKWVYDGGAGANADAVPDAATDPVILTSASFGSASVIAAMDEVHAAEAALSAAAAKDQKAAHLAALADDGRLYVAPLPPAIGASQYAAALDAWPSIFTFGAPEGGDASQAGDMAWTYGKANWRRGETDRNGWYVHLWQKRADGWKLAFAQLVPAPPPAPPAPPPPPAGG